MKIPAFIKALVYGTLTLGVALAAGYALLGEEAPQVLCAVGSPAYCAEAGLRAYHRKDYAQYLEYNTKSCEGGFATGCSNLGVSYEQGLGVKRDLAKARDYYENACQRESIIACRNLGNMYLRGLGVTKDRALAERYLRKACEGQLGEGCNDLGRIQANDPKGRQPKLELYGKACDYGDRDGCSNLAWLLAASPEASAADVKRAVELAAEGCVAEHPGSCVVFGRFLARGLGTRRDPGGARERYRFACERGAADGCRLLGLIFDTAEGVSLDLTQAEALLERACDLEDAPACLYVAKRLTQNWAPQLSDDERKSRIARYEARANAIAATTPQPAE